jgi:hypothetical protein
VILDFLDPFQEYLLSENYRLHPDSYRLTGNIRSIADGSPAPVERIDAMQEVFFATQEKWQRPSPGAKQALEGLAAHADVVFLTAMPPRHRDVRRSLLDAHALHYPMIATEEPKGPIARRLIGDRDVPVAFVDDIFHNLHSVRAHAPGCLLINLMSNATFRALAPDPGEDVHKAESWSETEALVRRHFGL